MTREARSPKCSNLPLLTPLPLLFVLFLFYLLPPPAGDSRVMELEMQHDLQLRAAARVIYNECYPTEDWAPVCFEEAEKFGTIHYRQAVGAAQRARAVLDRRYDEQLLIFAE